MLLKLAWAIYNLKQFLLKKFDKAEDSQMTSVFIDGKEVDVIGKCLGIKGEVVIIKSLTHLEDKHGYKINNEYEISVRDFREQLGRR